MAFLKGHFLKMPFESGRKRSAAANIMKGRQAKQQLRESECVSSEEEPGDEQIDDMTMVYTDGTSDISTCASSAPSASSELNASKIHARLIEIKERLAERDDELLVISDQMFILREEIIDANKKISHQTLEKITIIRTISQVRQSRDYYKKKLHNCKKKQKTLPKMISRRAHQAVSSRFPHTSYAYSALENAVSKNKRKIAALAALQDIGKETNVQALLDDLINYCDQCPFQTFKYHLSVYQSVIVKTECQLSKSQLELMKKFVKEFTGKDIFPSVKLTCEMSKNESCIHLFQDSIVRKNEKDVVVVQCTDLMNLLRWRLESVGTNLIFDSITGDDLVVVIGGDSGGGNTKICMFIANVEESNSVDNMLPIAVYDDTDSYECMAAYLPNLIEQFNTLDSISYTVNGTTITKNIRRKVVGDFKYISESLSHMKQNAVMFCQYCECPNHRNATTLKDLHYHQRSKLRTMQSYMQYSKKGEKGVKKGSGPLFKCLEVTDYMVGMLHLVTGVFIRYIFWPLWTECMTADNNTSFEVITNKDKTEKIADTRVENLQKKWENCVLASKKRELKIELDNLKEERKKFQQVLQGVPDGKWKKLEKCWERHGASRKAYFQMYNGNHTKKLLTQKAIEDTFDIFVDMMNDKLYGLKGCMEELGKIMSLSANRVLDDKDLETLTLSAWTFLAHLAYGFPDDTVTQKLHVLLFHIPDIAENQKTLGRITEQGVEGKHAQFNRIERRFVCYRNKSQRWMAVVKEMLCATLANDYLKA
ncbi:hypothetical protein CRE_21460 [Caenorhabditis remanei]|uniref:Uncharacterized protein n=1 Tax=Caenorhabditis remanei TaxID=31234 RepID=E3N3N1_CAERE|nr:hypothetical protein CRE_21460 [Caenorhabditis remanei]